MPLVPSRIGPLVFGQAKPSKPLKKPRIVVDTKLVSKAMDSLLPEIKAQFGKALNNFAEEVVTVIMDGTPVMTGDLQGSVRREKVKTTKTTVLVTVKAGGIVGDVRGEPINYAVIVHQLGSPKGRGRFFVIEPSLEMGEAFLPRMAGRAVERAVAKAR